MELSLRRIGTMSIQKKMRCVHQEAFEIPCRAQVRLTVCWNRLRIVLRPIRVIVATPTTIAPANATTIVVAIVSFVPRLILQGNHNSR